MLDGRDVHSPWSGRLRQLASVFIDAEDLAPTEQDTAWLTALLAESEPPFPPLVAHTQTSAVPRIQPMWVPDPTSPTGGPRFGAIDTFSGTTLMLLANRFDYADNSTEPNGTMLRPLTEFCAAAAHALSASVEHFRLDKARRLAVVQEGYLTKKNADVLKSHPDTLFCLPALFHRFTPFEWDWRVNANIARSFGGYEEQTNNIITLRRHTVRVYTTEPTGASTTEIDTVRLDIDINTLPKTTSRRFGADALSSYFAEAPEWHSELLDEIWTMIGGEP